MKLTLVSIIVGGVRHSRFATSKDGKVNLNQVFPFLSFLPKGTTVTVG